MNRELVSTSSSFPQSNGLRSDAGRLDSWKEIASYFRREVRTVQLWEKREGLPVHRHFHQQLGSVFAFRSELDAWNEQVSLKGAQGTQVAKPRHTPGSTEVSSEQAAKGRITIRVEPIKDDTLGGHTLCDAIAAKTIAVLAQLNPGRLRIEVVQPAGQKGCKSSSDSAVQDSVADYILTWGVQDNCDGLRVSAELLSVENRTVVWSQVYQYRQSDIDAMPGCLADQIVLCVWLKVISSPASCRSNCRSEKRDAREAYLKGRYFLKQRNEEAMRKAIHCFEAAIQQDRSFCPTLFRRCRFPYASLLL